jgi:hypothetical protein
MNVPFCLSPFLPFVITFNGGGGTCFARFNTMYAFL